MNECGACGLPLDEHDLEQARVCIKTLERQEPPYCRLTGPSDPESWLKATKTRAKTGAKGLAKDP